MVWLHVSLEKGHSLKTHINFLWLFKNCSLQTLHGMALTSLTQTTNIFQRPAEMQVHYYMLFSSGPKTIVIPICHILLKICGYVAFYILNHEMNFFVLHVCHYTVTALCFALRVAPVVPTSLLLISKPRSDVVSMWNVSLTLTLRGVYIRAKVWDCKAPVLYTTAQNLVSQPEHWFILGCILKS